MQWFLDLLPDLKVGTFEIRDVVSLGIGLLGSYLAFLAIKMGRDQEKIAKRQAEITEKQHQILEAQLAKKMDLRVITGRQNQKWDHETNDFGNTTVELKVHNGGDKAAEGFYWEVLVPRNMLGAIEFIDSMGHPFAGKFAPFSETDIYDKDDGHYPHKLSPFSGVEVTTLSIRPKHKRTEQFKIYWRIRCDDGLIPPEGLAEIGFKRMADGMFAFQDAAPGEKVDDDAEVVNQGDEEVT